MQRLTLLVARVTLGLLFVGLLSGCGKKYTVTGKITRGGKPIEWKSNWNRLLVHYAPEDREHNTALFPAKTDAVAGTYIVKDLPPGKYLIAVHVLEAPTKDVLGLSFNLVNSPLRYEVAADGEHNIDLPVKLPPGAKVDNE